MSAAINPSSVILHDFMIGALVFSAELLASRPSLKLQFSTKDAKIHKRINVSTESEDGIWMAKGSVKVSSTVGDIKVSILIEEDGLIADLCSATVACIGLARHAQEQPIDPCEILLEDVTSSTLLLVTCMTKVSQPLHAIALGRDLAPIPNQPLSGPNFPSFTRITTTSYYSLPKPPEPSLCARISPECLELERKYDWARKLPREDRSRALNDIGYRYSDLVEQIHHPVILDRSISILEEAVQCSSIFDPRRGQFLTDLSQALINRFRRTNDLAALDGALKASQDAVLIMGEETPYKARTLTTNGTVMRTRYEQFGEIEDLHLAIRQYAKAIESESDMTESIMILNDLARSLAQRFERLGDLQDLEVAITHFQKALKFTPDGRANKPTVLANLGGAFEARFNRLGRTEDIEVAVRYRQMALELISDDNVNRPVALSAAGNAFRRQFNRLGRVEDIEVAIRYLQQAVDLTPDFHPKKSFHLNSLGKAFYGRFERFGRLEDIESAIHYKRLAIELTPHGHPGMPSVLNSLGVTLMLRFQRLGSLKDINDAIYHLQLAVELTPVGHPETPGRLDNLGIAFRERFCRLRRIEDINTAIHHLQLAVELAPDGDPQNSVTQNNLANSLDDRFHRLKRVEDIEASISYRRTTVKLTPEGHPLRPDFLTNLARTLVARFKHIGDIKDIEEAITSNQMALDLLPKGHPHEFGVLTNLETAFYCRYEKLRQADDLQGAYTCSSSVANLVSAPPAHRLKQAHYWAVRSRELGLSPLPAYQIAVNMLPRIAWLGLPIHDQHALLEKIGTWVCDSIGGAIEAEEHELAVEWAEAGRSVVWQNFLNLRSPLDELYAAHPKLATRLQLISQQLQGVGQARNEVGEEKFKSMKMVDRSPTLLALDWDNTVEEIRRNLGFEAFLKAKSFTQLARVAREGPVVVLNVQIEGCAALLLIPAEMGGVHATSIPLPDINYKGSQELHLDLIKVLTLGHVRDRNELAREDRKGYRLKEKPLDGKALEGILKSLWLKLVKPVVEALAYQPQTTDLPHIWWCATGPLAFLPIHAAGLYDADHEEPGHKLSDYVVSSYTPTLSALLDNSTPNPKDVKLLAVAQADAPGASRIPNTEVEVERIKKAAVDVPLTVLTKGEATIERVLEGMEKSSWVHLACHGQQNIEQPMKSGLLLHDGKLELEKLIAKRLPNADFAFLSACQTATGDAKVAEESVHLAAGMLFSGFKGVIATMWSIDDSIAPQIAEDVYRYMLGDGKPDRKKAAHALHYAVRRLREEDKADFLTWVPFIHIGR